MNSFPKIKKTDIARVSNACQTTDKPTFTDFLPKMGLFFAVLSPFLTFHSTVSARRCEAVFFSIGISFLICLLDQTSRAMSRGLSAVWGVCNTLYNSLIFQEFLIMLERRDVLHTSLKSCILLYFPKRPHLSITLILQGKTRNKHKFFFEKHRTFD